jgi:hypothetical protein
MMTRLWPGGQLVAVAVDDQNQPLHFTWCGRRHQVVAVTRSWRVDLEWWQERIWRAYFKLHTDSGLLVVLYQDLVGGEWYLERLYD